MESNSYLEFENKPHLVLDIGGGSTELILADDQDARALTSTRVGAVRLQTDFIKKEPISSARLQFLKTFIQGSMEPAVEKVCHRLKTSENPLMGATSGTALAIGALIASEESNPTVAIARPRSRPA